MSRKCLLLTLGLILLMFLPISYSYEKTLRKIVRNQSKMIHRPFSSDELAGNSAWGNLSQAHGPGSAILQPGYSQVNTLFYKTLHPNKPTILSSVDTGRNKTPNPKIKISRSENMNPIEQRLARNTFKNSTVTLYSTTEGSFLFPPHHTKNNTEQEDFVVESYYQIPTAPKLSPSVNDQELQSVEQKIKVQENTIVIPADPVDAKKNNSLLLKRIFIGDKKTNEKLINLPDKERAIRAGDSENDQKADFLLEVVSTDTPSKYNYNVTDNPYICSIVKEVKTDIDTSSQFSNFDIEPSWLVKKHFWNNLFDSRYESLMRNSKWPPLRVILIPLSRVDSIWKRSFEHYHNNTVNKIISNIVKKLQFYSNLTFTWNEVSHLSQWWKRTSLKSRLAFRKLVKSGRLEITTGGWVESDEATAHLFGLIHQLIEGHQWLKCNLNYNPKVGWFTNSVTHSPTLPYLLSASGITKMVITKVHYSWEQYLSEFQISDFLWVQNYDNDKNSVTPLNQALGKIGNDRYPKSSVLTHYLQFNSDNFKACGPNKDVCASEFDFRQSNKKNYIRAYNIKQKSEMLLEQYSKSGTLSPHNTIIAPVGGSYRYEFQSEFDFQYNNYQKLADFININRNIYTANVKFGTPKDYFKSILRKNKSYPTLQGDFLNFADTHSGSPAYWSGFFTSRPILKILLRRVQSILRTSEILLSFASSFDVFSERNISNLFKLLIKSRETLARLQDRHVLGGTLNFNTLQYVYKQIIITANDCWHIQETATSFLTSKPENRTIYLKKLLYRESEFFSASKTVSTGDKIYVFNSMSQERTEIVELITENPNLRVIDHKKKDLTIQINPVWSYSTDNIIMISNSLYKITFAIVVPPLTLELYRIKETYDASQNAASIYCVHCRIDSADSESSRFPFNMQPIQPGDIQLESYKHRIVIDEITGLLKTVIEKDTDTEKSVVIDYGAFNSADVNSGIFLFNTNATRPIHDILLPYRDGTNKKVAIIIAGQVTSEIVLIYGRLLQNSIKLYNLINSPLANSISIETKVDYEVSPKNRELEVFLSIKTDISNGNQPEIYTDNNGFQYTRRTLNISRRIESNVYPITTMAYIQDSRNRLTLITDHAQGVTALQEGQLVVMLDRRVLFNDGRGTHEGLADNSAVHQRHYILLEHFVETANQYDDLHRSELKLPSFSAVYLANSMDYTLELFMAHNKVANLAYFSFLPLIKTSFPCDVTVLNLRLVLNTESPEILTHSVALLILHRQSVSCHIDYSMQRHCDGDSSFQIEKILRNVKSVQLCNLVGTDDGVPILSINRDNLKAMELMTLKIYF